MDLDQDLAFAHLGFRDFFQFQNFRLAEFMGTNGFHTILISGVDILHRGVPLSSVLRTVVEERWVAQIVADNGLPPGPDDVKGLGFYAYSSDEAERLAKVYVGMANPVN